MFASIHPERWERYGHNPVRLLRATPMATLRRVAADIDLVARVERLAQRLRHAGVAPEAGVGGPLAAVQEGDIIVIDTAARRLDVELSDDEIAKRLGTWSPPAPKYDRGVLAKYAALVTQADNGAIMRGGLEL